MIDTQTSVVRDRRSFERYATDLECKLNFAGREVWGQVLDVSRAGAGIKLLVPMLTELGSVLDFVEIPKLGRLPCVIRWRTQDRLGVEFTGGILDTEKVISTVNSQRSD